MFRENCVRCSGLIDYENRLPLSHHRHVWVQVSTKLDDFIGLTKFLLMRWNQPLLFALQTTKTKLWNSLYRKTQKLFKMGEARPSSFVCDA